MLPEAAHDPQMDETRLRAIESRCSAATPGPWDPGQPLEDDGPEFWWDVWSDDGSVAHLSQGARRTRKQVRRTQYDAAFIAASRTDVPDLVAEVRRLQGEVAALRQLDMCGTCYDLLDSDTREAALAAAEARGKTAGRAEVIAEARKCALLCYHWSPRSRRESILAGGLRPSSPPACSSAGPSPRTWDRNLERWWAASPASTPRGSRSCPPVAEQEGADL